MSESIKIKDVDVIIEMYFSQKKSLSDISHETGFAQSAIRRTIIINGYTLRTRVEAINCARHKLGVHLKGKKRSFTREHLENMKEAGIKRRLGHESVSLKPSGYIVVNNGCNFGKSAHKVVMEEFLGRSLRANECVHHIDHDKTNNKINNLALLTISGHARLHRFEDELAGYKMERDKKGRLKGKS